MLGWQELILILAILLLVFGPSKLPQMAKELGRAVYEFRKASEGVSKSVNSSLGAVRNERIALMRIARKLNIPTEGKTIEQIAQEIAIEIGKRDKAGDSIVEVKKE